MPAEWEPHDGDVDRMAAQCRGLAGEISADSVGLCGDRAASRGVEQVHILVQNADGGKRARGVLKRAQREHGQRALPSVADEPGVDAGLRADLLCKAGDESAARIVAVTNWKFNAWAKYPDWHLDDALPGPRGGAAAAAALDADGRTLADGPRTSWCSKAAASIPTARACCLRPRSAC